VLAGADHRDEVDVAGDRVHLGDARDRGDLLSDIRQRALLGGDEDDGGDQSDFTSTSCSADFT
jgi:hypothetical protein